MLPVVAVSEQIPEVLAARCTREEGAGGISNEFSFQKVAPDIIAEEPTLPRPLQMITG
jgi:hypothetical protein